MMMEKLLKILFIALILVFVLMLLFYIDGFMGSSKVVSGIVISKKHDAAWTEVQINSDGQNTWTTTVYHPEEWSVEIYSITIQGSFRTEVKESDFSTIRQDERINVSAQIGRFTHAVVWSRYLGPAEAN
jgi:hypothetical protein